MNGYTTTPCKRCNGTGIFNNNRKYKCFACDGTGVTKFAKHDLPPAMGTTTPVTKLFEVFRTALKNHLNLKFRADGVTFKWRGAWRGYAESIMILDPTKEFGQNMLGHLTPDDKLWPAHHNQDWNRFSIIWAVLADPEKEARLYGLKFNHCCICGLTLTNALSVKLGIGPICRGRVGWGFGFGSERIDEAAGNLKLADDFDDLLKSLE